MRNKKGFTLLEIMTAIAVIGLISGPLLYMFITSSKVGRHSYDVNQANAITVEAIEKLKASPGDINDTNFFYSYTYDGEKYFHNYNRTVYYDINWNIVPSAADAAFRADFLITGEDNQTGGVQMSYIPELVRKSGPQSGQNYTLSVNYAILGSGIVNYTVEESGSDYIVTGPGIVSSLSSIEGTVVIPTEDCVSGVIPIIIDIGNNPQNYIEFVINNKTSLETGLYIYGDYSNDPHFITTSPMSGTVSINYMKASTAELVYNELDVNVKIVRIEDNDTLSDYTTMIYLAQYAY